MKKLIVTMIIALCLMVTSGMQVFALVTNVGTIKADFSTSAKEKTGDTEFIIKCKVSSNFKGSVDGKFVVLKDSKILKEYALQTLKKDSNINYVTKDKFKLGDYRIEFQIKNGSKWQVVSYANITVKGATVSTVSSIHFAMDNNILKLQWTNPKDISQIDCFEIYSKKDSETIWTKNFVISTDKSSIDLTDLIMLCDKSVSYMLKISSKAKVGFVNSEATCEKKLTYIYKSENRPVDLNYATIFNDKITVSSIDIIHGCQYLVTFKDATSKIQPYGKVLTAIEDRRLVFNVDNSANSLEKSGNKLFLQKLLCLINENGDSAIISEPRFTRGTTIANEKLVDLNEVGTFVISPEIQVAIKKSTLPEATPQHLPYWTGLNLGNKVNYEFGSIMFEEGDIKKIHDMGFNFIRANIHYKTLLSEDEAKIRMSQIEDIDRLIQWGIKYNVHINLDLHYLPGHGPSDLGISKQDLFTNERNKQLSYEYWAMLAKRYEGIPNKILSFNLLNEPGYDVNDENYSKLMERIAAAVRVQDTNRLMIIDGLQAGSIASEASKNIDLSQSMHNYAPNEFTTANFNLTGGIKTPLPQGWPMEYVNGALWGTTFEQYGKFSAMTIKGDFQKGIKVKTYIQDLSTSSTMDIVIKADGKEVKRKTMQAGFNGMEFEALVKDSAKVIEISAQGPDNSWVRVKWVSIIEEGKKQVDIIATDYNFNADATASIITIDDKDIYKNTNPLASNKKIDINWLRSKVKLWKDFSVKNNVGIMCGEFGVANSVPHNMTLDYLKDFLTVLQENKIGWSFYDFSGYFGLFNSNRPDVTYEPYGDLNLDGELLALLQKYQKELP